MDELAICGPLVLLGDLRHTKVIYLAHAARKDSEPGAGNVVEGALREFRPFRVTANLEAALRVFRYHSDKIGPFFWIDALSINQGDLAERSNQVSLMREIYSQASCVPVWLGADPSNEQAVHFITYLYRHRRSTFGEECELAKLPGDEIPSLDFSMTGSFKGMEVNDLIVKKSISKFFKNPWFRRIWVVQEVHNALGPVIFWFSSGSQALTLTCPMLTLARSWLVRRYEKAPFGDVTTFSNLWAFVRKIRDPDMRRKHPETDKDSHLELLELFRRTCYVFQASEPKDKLFALLGIAKETYQKIPTDLSPN